jgi:hypothetical protein
VSNFKRENERAVCSQRKGNKEIKLIKLGIKNTTGNVRVNVTMRLVRLTIVAMGKQRVLYYVFWLYVCKINHTACNARASCYIVVICGLTCCTILFHIVL